MDDIKRELEARISELHQEGLATVNDFLNIFRTDLKEIEVLDGNQRQVRLMEIKKMLLDHLIENHPFRNMIPVAYNQIIIQQLRDILNAT